MATVDIDKIIGCDNIAEMAKTIVRASAMTSFSESGNYICTYGDLTFFAKIVIYQTLATDQWRMPQLPKCTTVDAEIKIMRAIKTKIIDPGFSPHFPEILAVTKCKNIAKYIEDRAECGRLSRGQVKFNPYPQSLLCALQGLVQSEEAIDKFAILYSEPCDLSLSQYLQNFAPPFSSIRELTIQSIIFQVYYSLCVLQRIWPKFRHGDLFMRNVMIKLIDDKYYEKLRYVRYVIDQRAWCFPFFGLFVKIIDFGHGQIPEEGILSSIIRPGDTWIPDAAGFICDFQAFVGEMDPLSPSLLAMFRKLNPANLGGRATVTAFKEVEKQFPSVQAALEKAFTNFENNVSDELIIKEYRCPPND